MANVLVQHVHLACEHLDKVILGKSQQIRLAVTCLLSGGHLLIEDLPGMGKTTLAHALASVFGLNDTRVQFTSDMLPADILGVSVFDAVNSVFVFHPGPIFTQLLLADEINRTTPKTQSALLEAMEEGQVTQDGETRRLPHPFFVIATQNPLTQFGTFPLPESQLDRFLMRINLGYPSPEAERALLSRNEQPSRRERMPAVLSSDQLIQAQIACQTVHASADLIHYVQRLVQFTREEQSFSYGVSPRGALALLRCAKSWAWLHNRQHVVPEDVQHVLEAVVGHRVRAAEDMAGHTSTRLVNELISRVDVMAH